MGDDCDREKVKHASYKLQSKLSKSKSDFSNGILYEIVVSDDVEAIPELPKYITDGLIWLADSVKNQVNGGQ